MIAPHAPSRPTRVAVVDDDPGVVEWLGEELRHAGFETTGFTDPERALARLPGAATKDCATPGSGATAP